MYDWIVGSDQLLGFFDRFAPPPDVEEVKGMLQSMANAIHHLDACDVDTQVMKDMWNMAAAALFQASLIEKMEEKMDKGVSQGEVGYDPCVHAIVSFAVISALTLCDDMLEEHMTPGENDGLQ